MQIKALRNVCYILQVRVIKILVPIKKLAEVIILQFIRLFLNNIKK